MQSVGNSRLAAVIGIGQKAVLWAAVIMSCSAALCAAPRTFDLEMWDETLGLKGSWKEQENLYLASWPRTDVKVLVDYNTLSPFMGLASTVGIKSVEKERYFAIGELVVFEDEVNPIISALLDAGIDVTGLATHFFHDKPSVHFLQFQGYGRLPDLGKGIKTTQNIIKQIRTAKPTVPKDFESKPYPETNTISLTHLESVLGFKGQSHEGTIKFEIPRNKIAAAAKAISFMGIYSWIAFAGSDENAVVDGRLIVKTTELQAVLKALRKGDIDLTSIYTMMVDGSPGVISLHFWGRGAADPLAKSIQEALKAAYPH